MGSTAYQALRWRFPGLAWATIAKPKAPRNEARLRQSVMTSEELQQFHATLTTRERALVGCFLVMRRFEAAGRRWRDLDFQDGTASFIGKAGRPRWTPLPVSTLIALGEWFVESGCPPGDAPVFPGQISGRPMSPKSVSNLVRQRLHESGLYREWRGPHAWRRSFARAYLEVNRDDLIGLKEMLGHADISTTQRYLFTLPNDLRPRLDRVRL